MELNGNSILWFLAIVLLAGGGLNGFLGVGRPMGPAPATIEDVNNAINNQTLQSRLADLGVETANNNYETAMLINQQNNLMQQQQNTNLLTAINGFNAITQQIQAQNAALSQQIAQLGYNMDKCCCTIQTQNLQHWYEEAKAKNVELATKLDNRDQTQTIFNAFGRFVPWAGSGSLTPATVTG